MENNMYETNSRIAPANRVDHILARWRINRGGHRTAPGLYTLGKPDSNSPVFVSANNSLSFDALRKNRDGIDCYILVLNTHGINVWCAAGKGTFGTDELINRIEETDLSSIVKHRRLILPQLGAPGIMAHEVKKHTGFTVKYGPVRADDIQEYLRKGKITEDMRTVKFPLRDRLVLVPVELMGSLLFTLIIASGVYFLDGITASLAVLAALFAGTVLFPPLLPWLPTPNFSTKGFFLGAVTSVPIVILIFLDSSSFPLWFRLCRAVIYFLTMTSTTAFIALNFTGATTFTSKSGVEREMSSYIRPMALMFGGGLLLAIVLLTLKLTGVTA